jgi:hypothetical protein
MGTQAAGRELANDYVAPRLPHPGPRCAHTEDRPLPRPAATPSHHMQVGGLSQCVSAPVFLWLTTKGHAKLLDTAAALLPCRLLSRLLTPAWRSVENFSSHPRKLHAHAAHRVPTARADRPPCRPDTGMRPSCTHSCALFLGCSFPSRRHCYFDPW